MHEIIVGLITASGAVVCQIIISLTGRTAARQERAESQKLITYRLEQLEKKVTLHNNVVERTDKLEEESAVMQEKIKVANNRISDLEKRSVTRNE